MTLQMKTQWNQGSEVTADPALAYVDQSGHEPQGGQNREVVSKLASKVGELALNIAVIYGTIDDVSVHTAEQAKAFNNIATAIQSVNNTNAEMQGVLDDVFSSAVQVSAGIDETVSLAQNIFTESSRAIGEIGQSSDAMINELDEIAGKISGVHEFSRSIETIATETQMLAINAGIMAARAGDEGKGFAVIAESIRELAQQTSDVSKNMGQELRQLKSTLGDLQAHRETNEQIISDARTQAEGMSNEFTKFRAFGTDVKSLTESISSLTQPAEKNVQVCASVLDKMQDLNETADLNSQALNSTAGKVENVLSFSEDMILLVEESGVKTKDSELIDQAVGAARQISNLFDQAIQSGLLSEQQIFDENYRSIANTDPQQVVTKYTQFTDQHLPEILEPFLATDPRVVFCAAVDRNGYLPTHNKKYSKPQSNDPIWNAANCRNRRIFNDRTCLKAGRNTQAFVLQTYRRDMGGGSYVMMKDLSAPIYVRGRHWGGFRVGYKVS